jgi:hypothetical protein
VNEEDEETVVLHCLASRMDVDCWLPGFWTWDQEKGPDMWGGETNCMEQGRIKVAFSYRFHQFLVISHHGFASINSQLIKQIKSCTYLDRCMSACTMPLFPLSKIINKCHC